MLDMHCHILFGVDDGAQTIQESLEMLREASRVGIRTIVATPHVKAAETDLDRFHNPFNLLAPYAHEMGIQLLLGCELHYGVLARAGMEDARKWCVAGTNRLLLEFSDGTLPAWDYLLGDLKELDIRVIIAHPERNAVLQRQPEIAERMIQLGAVLQVDAGGAVSGSRAEKRFVRYLHKGNIPFILASDAHSAADYAPLARAAATYSYAIVEGFSQSS